MKLRWMIGLIAALCITLLGPLAAFAEDEDSSVLDSLEESEEDEGEEADEEDEDEAPVGTAPMADQSLASQFLQMIGGLLVVVAILYGFLIIVRRRTQKFQANRTMQNLGGVALGGNKSVQVVKIGSRVYVVGVGENVQYLEEISDDEELAALTNGPDMQGQWVNKAAGWMQERMKKPSPQGVEEEAHETLKDTAADEMQDVQSRHNDWHQAIRERRE
ncbi:flagellar protein FliO/FliZ [Salsuginibacillus halophilus]|uniref:Flagellar protein FliO/FliZ n=1 Tax=Salsuginibacillus halophilus TaxID=517424 RepID=A0A2P8HY86_9BACI|nr:flagellar biosynthetic protein FliO [Salsuginibacillus halophilus]PSL51202.1 flagellar protein FliO/FliZ [Salsuginibacillus halophilus]